MTVLCLTRGLKRSILAAWPQRTSGPLTRQPTFVTLPLLLRIERLAKIFRAADANHIGRLLGSVGASRLSILLVSRG